MTEKSNRELSFVQVDVFTDHIFGGNPLAVFLQAEGLSDVEMQHIAGEMNLSETTFVSRPTRPGCAARVRIFTPSEELPFAGHPTIGTSYVLATRAMVADHAQEFQLEEKVGDIPVRLTGNPSSPDSIWMQHPPASFGPAFDNTPDFARALGLEPSDLLARVPVQVVSTGVPFLFVPLRDANAVDRASLDVKALLACPPDSRATGVFIFAPHPDAAANRVYSRMFAPHTLGITEDPATGGASGPLGAYLVKYGLAVGDGEVSIVSEQGTKMGRQSFIHIRVDVDAGEARRIEIGGGVVPVLEGILRLG